MIFIHALQNKLRDNIYSIKDVTDKYVKILFSESFRPTFKKKVNAWRTILLFLSIPLAIKVPMINQTKLDQISPRHSLDFKRTHKRGVKTYTDEEAPPGVMIFQYRQS